MALRGQGYETIMINSNPETVSTDFDTSDKLYFEPLTLEDVLEIVDREQPIGVIVQLGGQTPLKLTRGLEKAARIKRQLGGSGDYADPVPERAKGMHQRTYERLCNEGEEALLPYQDRLLKRLPGLLARLGRSPKPKRNSL